MGNSVNASTDTNELTYYVYDELEKSMKDWFNNEKFYDASSLGYNFIIYSPDISLYPIISLSKYSALMLLNCSKLDTEKTMIGFLGLNFYTPQDQAYNHT